MACLAPLTKEIASLIIDEISLLSTSVLIFSPRVTKALMSEMHVAKSPTLVGETKAPAPQSGRAVWISAMAVYKSAIMDDMSFPAWASEMNCWIS
jgi:hypothetical protein